MINTYKLSRTHISLKQRVEKSSPAKHISLLDHKINLDNLQFLRDVTKYILDSLESVEIYKNRYKNMNRRRIY